jgi:hypothetical protein
LLLDVSEPLLRLLCARDVDVDGERGDFLAHRPPPSSVAKNDSAETVAGVSDALAEVQVSLDEKPAELEAQLDAKLSKPVADAVTRLQTLEKSLAPLARNFQTALRRQILATFLAGVTVGVLASVIILLA